VTAEAELKRTKDDLENKMKEIKEKATSQLIKIQRNTQNTIDSYLDKFQSQVALSTIKINFKDQTV